MTTEPLGLSPRMNHVAIMAPDLDEGVRWYEEKFGFRLTDRWANEATGMEWAHLAQGDFVFELVKRPGLGEASPGNAGWHHIALTVEDVDGTVEALRSRDVEIFMEPQDFARHDMRWAFVKDYLGNVIELIQLNGSHGH
jgi:catechol 2,3-dioxygenase-like lactoylglutathione lyase family enzyme